MIKAVRANLLGSSNPLNPQPDMIPSLAYEKAVVTYLPHCFEIMRRMRRLGCSPPVLVGITLIGVRGMTLAGAITAIDRDIIMLPDIVMEDLSASAGSFLKSTLDLVWNACGQTSSPYFDAAGNWKGRDGR